jgi:hypothetical protein
MTLMMLIMTKILPRKSVLSALLWIVSVAAPAQGAESSTQADWERVVGAARKEGALVVSIPASDGTSNATA